MMRAQCVAEKAVRLMPLDIACMVDGDSEEVADNGDVHFGCLAND